MIKAVIFDLDGVLIDSEPLHMEAWRRFCKKTGRHLSRKQLEDAIGHYDAAVVRPWFGKHLTDKEVEEVVRQKFKEYYALLSEKFPTFPGVRECVETLARGFRLAIATSEWRASIELAAERLGITSYIEASCGKEDVTHHKPHPEIYLKLTRMMELSPEEVAAVEDSPAGVRSARAAGCKCIGVTNSFSEEVLKNAGADAVVSSLKHPERILELLQSF
jgi:HAD superfamily hydrolase (TIGR01509 family)